MKKTFLTSLFAITLAACSEAVVPEPQPVDDTTDTVSEVLDAVTEEPEIIIEESTDAETEDEEPVIVIEEEEVGCIPPACEYGQFFDEESCSCIWCRGDENSDCCLGDICFSAVHYDGQSTYMVSSHSQKFDVQHNGYPVLDKSYINEELFVYTYKLSKFFYTDNYGNYYDEYENREEYSPNLYQDQMCPKGTHLMNTVEFYSLFNVKECSYCEYLELDYESHSNVLGSGEYNNWRELEDAEDQDIFNLHLIANSWIHQHGTLEIKDGEWHNILLQDNVIGKFKFYRKLNWDTEYARIKTTKDTEWKAWTEDKQGGFDIRCVLDR